MSINATFKKCFQNKPYFIYKGLNKTLKNICEFQTKSVSLQIKETLDAGKWYYIFS